jgi:hypothetical protein
MVEEPMLTITQASRYTGLPTSVLGHAASLDPPQLRCFQNGPRGRRYFKPSDLDAFVASMANTPAPKKTRRSPRQKVNN